MKQTRLSEQLTRPQVLFPALSILLAIVGMILYRYASHYPFLSSSHVIDLMRAKFWSIGWILIAALVLYFRRHSPDAPTWSIFFVSAYFVILYGLLFKGTQYGMNGHWGDNGNRLAEICKMMAYNSPFQDWYLKDLPSFYPPGWFWLMALYAKLLDLEAYQTIKYGYLLIFLVYPWLLYFSWRKLVKPASAAAVVIATLFLAFRYMDWIYYELITAGLFLPWWLYHFEGGHGAYTEPVSFRWPQYLCGALIGAALALIYYYWFIMAFMAIPATLIFRYLAARSWSALWLDIRHKLTLMTGVLVLTSVFWLPLLLSLLRYGAQSAQHLWWGIRHADLTRDWTTVSFESLWIFAGIFFAFYLGPQLGRGRLPFFYLGGLLTIQADRVYNFFSKSVQSRKVLEMVHVFAAAPLALGVMELWDKTTSSPNLRRGLVGLGLLAAVITANEHTELADNEKYRNAVTQRVPSGDLAVFDAVTTRGTVFLTNDYISACYRPFYQFIPHNNMTAHTGGRFAQRKAFLKQLARVTEPDLLAYALKYNRYNSVDYVYLPLVAGKSLLVLYETDFNQSARPDSIKFAADIGAAPTAFVKRHERGMYELAAPPRTAETDSLVSEKYPSLLPHLTGK